MLKKNLGEAFSPLYFLAALGAGGLTVSFFMYPMFMVPHPDTPMITFNHLWPILTGDNLWLAGLIALNLLAVAFFAVLHFRLLAWNLREFMLFRRTPAFDKLRQSNGKISLMAVPLTLAMTINVCFVLGALFVPNLWSVVEYLFPVAILGFLAVGIYALKILTAYFARVLTEGGMDFASNNSLSPMIAIFALAMIAVGFAGPGAMSEVRVMNAIGISLSLFFLSAAVLLAVIKLVMGFKAMMEHGISEAASPSLWIMIPILTLMGITWIRLVHGLHFGFNAEMTSSSFFVITVSILGAQILFGLIGWMVMRRLGYFRDYVHGDKGNAGSFSLICPGVAFFVFGIFFLTFGLVQTGLLQVLSPVYLLILAPFVYVQLKTISTLFVLQKRILTA
ncbi:TsoY family (seleno)protein [Thiorhodospira sibirica]|uniref:TsoY family (seleno)protein n=1 Tax=Thiorhodospira sibirica TaxID=154347 RepID=UPI00022C0B24|nr:hypothetical protein [Thiorhodospira sibirica]